MTATCPYAEDEGANHGHDPWHLAETGEGKPQQAKRCHNRTRHADRQASFWRRLAPRADRLILDAADEERLCGRADDHAQPEGEERKSRLSEIAWHQYMAQ